MRPAPGLYVALPYDRGFSYAVVLCVESGRDQRAVISEETAIGLAARGLTFDTDPNPVPVAPGSIDLAGLRLSKKARRLLESR